MSNVITSYSIHYTKLYENTIELFLILVGAMAIWGGIMQIAEKSGITNKLSYFFKPIAKLLFKGINPDGKAFVITSYSIHYTKLYDR